MGQGLAQLYLGIADFKSEWEKGHNQSDPDYRNKDLAFYSTLTLLWQRFDILSLAAHPMILDLNLFRHRQRRICKTFQMRGLPAGTMTWMKTCIETIRWLTLIWSSMQRIKTSFLKNIAHCSLFLLITKPLWTSSWPLQTRSSFLNVEDSTILLLYLEWKSTIFPWFIVDPHSDSFRNRWKRKKMLKMIHT